MREQKIKNDQRHVAMTNSFPQRILFCSLVNVKLTGVCSAREVDTALTKRMDVFVQNVLLIDLENVCYNS